MAGLRAGDISHFVYYSLDLSLGIEVSKDVTALVKDWLQREDDQKVKLPTPPKIKHWPER